MNRESFRAGILTCLVSQAKNVPKISNSTLMPYKIPVQIVTCLELHIATWLMMIKFKFSAEFYNHSKLNHVRY